jgi:hypothetical protein
MVLSLDQHSKAHNYQIRVRGHLDRGRSTWFEGLEITFTNGDTLLTGSVKDQTALYSLLDKLRDLGLELISVERLPETNE